MVVTFRIPSPEGIIRRAVTCIGAVIVYLFAGADTRAQFIDRSDDRVKTPLTVPMTRIGTIQPRRTDEIASSRLTVGCETLDRDYTDFEAYKAYLPPLGIKKIRLQAGWAKTEKTKGVYDWKWLDEIIDFASRNGIEPWLETSYGNPIYEGGGGTGLLHSLMTSQEGYAAWDRWVEALVTRYRDRVKEWEIWNEPDHPMQKITAETTAALNIRTAAIIKRLQPEARIAGLAFASHTNTVYLDRFLKTIQENGDLNHFTWISYHSYSMRPEDSYKGVAAMQRVIDQYSDKLLLRQGENGAPSGFIPSFALDQYYWTEYTQAKYNMRRILGDLGRDIETSVFGIIDMYYDWGDRAVLNMKGLIQSDKTKKAIRPKVAYYAMQHVAALFDASLVTSRDFSFEADTDTSLSVFAFAHKSTNQSAIALWADADIPSNAFATQTIRFTFQNIHFTNPVWVDLMTGAVYALRDDQWKASGDQVVFNVPVYDSPVLLAEKALVLRN